MGWVWFYLENIKPEQKRVFLYFAAAGGIYNIRGGRSIYCRI